MARTANVAVNELITSLWGNQIRDRTVQVFTTEVELKAWAAPVGSFGYVSSRNQLWVRNQTNTWRLYRPFWVGNCENNTSADGDVLWSHGLGEDPTWTIAQPIGTNDTFYQCSFQSSNDQLVRYKCRNYEGVLIKDRLVRAFVIVGASLS